MTAEFQLETVGGQWRIAALPEGFGRWIASTEVNRLVRPYAVHYVSTSQRALIPDVRWFPVDRLATRLARAQILPLPEHFDGAAVTAVPLGARPVSYTHLRAHETVLDLVCRLLLDNKTADDHTHHAYIP